MNILISGGAKTNNIVNALSNKFKTGGVEFTVVEYLEDIEDRYSIGEKFDRIIIIDKSWNHDMKDTDEFSIRQRINDFARASYKNNKGNTSYVFLNVDRENATMVYEESLQLQADSVVLVNFPRKP